MEAWTSRIHGASLAAITEGFSQHRKYNRSVHAAQSYTGSEERVLRHRAHFAADRAKSLQSRVKTAFIDHKVWTA